MDIAARQHAAACTRSHLAAGYVQAVGATRRVLVGGPVLIALGAGCSYFGVPDEQPAAVEEWFGPQQMGGMGLECVVLGADAERVATADDPYGGPDYQWWIAPSSTGGYWEVVLQVDGDGRGIGGAGGGGGCEPLPEDPSGISWSGGGGNGPPKPAVNWGGRVPAEAAQVRLTFDGEPPIVTAVQSDGYFLVVLPEDPSATFGFPPDTIEALDDEGRVVATRHL